ncbi:TPA: hypothetical protein ACH3X1_006352 [Trebouxia sp. C0004]
MSDTEINYNDELDFGLDGLFEDEPPAEEKVFAAAAAAEDVPPAEPEQPEPAWSQCWRYAHWQGQSQGKSKKKLHCKLAARRAVAADAAEQAADMVGSDNLTLDAEQVEPDLVESAADVNERVGLDRHAPARFVAGSRHANLTTSPLLRPTGVTGTGPINAGADGAVYIEEYRTLQIKLKTALAEKQHLSQQCHNSGLLIDNLLDLVRPAAAVGTGTVASGAPVAPRVPLPPVPAPVKALEPRKPKPFSGEAPQGLGVNGKWLDPNSLMSHAVQQSQALACGGGKDATPATYMPVPVRKRPHTDVGRSSPARPTNKKSNLVKSGFRGKAEFKWLGDISRCYHCTEKGHRSSECKKKAGGVPASSMPTSYSSAGAAKE